MIILWLMRVNLSVICSSDEKRKREAFYIKKIQANIYTVTKHIEVFCRVESANN
jgi:hypothetical protein